MKTSNKILLGFLIVVFAIPIFLVMGFRSKIRDRRFTAVQSDFDMVYGSRKGKLPKYKVVKIMGPESYITLGVDGPGVSNVFTCNIISSHEAKYMYNNHDLDSVRFEQKGDTLLIKYIGPIERGTVDPGSTTYSHILAAIYLPDLSNIIVDNAIVSMDSTDMGMNAEMYFDLRNHAGLDLGINGANKTTTVAVTGVNKGDTATILQESVIKERNTGLFNKIKLKTSQSKVVLGGYAWIKELNLEVKETSEIVLDDNSRIDQLSGFISDSCTVKANWKNIRRLASLTKD